MELKLCKRCGLEKSPSKFYRLSSAPDGRQYQCKACKQENYQKHYNNPLTRSRMLKCNSEWRCANPQSFRKSSKKYYRNNKEKLLQSQRDYRRSEHGKKLTAEAGRRRRAWKLGAEGSFTEDEWQQVVQLFGFKCANPNCSNPSKPLTKDHIVPLSIGGTDYITNIQPLCRPCNSSKGTTVTKY